MTFQNKDTHITYLTAADVVILCNFRKDLKKIVFLLCGTSSLDIMNLTNWSLIKAN